MLCELQNATCVCMLPLHDVHKLGCFSCRAEIAVPPSWLNRPEFNAFFLAFDLLSHMRWFYSCGQRFHPSVVFQSTLPDDVFENGGCGIAECKRLSFTFSDTSGSTASPSPALSCHSPGQSNPEITVTPPETNPSPTQIFPTREDSIAEERLMEEEEEEEDAYEEDGERGSRGSRATSGSLASDEAEVTEDSEWERTESQRNSASNGDSAAPSLCSDGHLSTVAPEDVFLDHSDELKPVELDTEEAGSLTRQLVKRLTSSEIAVPTGSPTEGAGGTVGWAGEGSRAFLETSLEEAIQSLLMKLESLTHRCRELQDLEQEVMRLEDILKVPALFCFRKLQPTQDV